MAEQSSETTKSQQRTNPEMGIKPGFSVKLEALRGLAALMVVGHHAFADPWTRSLFDGNAAVTLFFVLSGYVLGLSLRRGTGTVLQQYCLFLWHRVFRLYPAYFITTLAFWIYWQWYPFREGGTGPHSFFENLQIGHLRQIKNFLFLDQSVNPVTWSLKVEMIGSIVLPFLHFLSRRLRWRGWLLLLTAMVLLGFVPDSGGTRQRLYMFYLGYLIPEVEKFPKFSSRIYSMITCAAIGLFLSAHLLGTLGLPHFPLLIEAVSAAGIILSIQAGGGSLGGILNRPWSHFAGRISYSVFLSHWMTLDVVGQLLQRSPLQIIIQQCPVYPAIWLRLLISLPFILLVATALYYWIEVPFIRLGRDHGLAARWRKVRTS